MENIPAPEKAAPRWMNDNDMKLALTLVSIKQVEQGKVLAVFTTPIGEELQKEMNTSRPEYAFIYNGIQSGHKQFIYNKTPAGRMPVSYA